MALEISREAVKRAASVSSSEYDAVVDALIAELLPVIEACLSAEALADSHVQPVLQRGAIEVIAGEFLAQRLREEGAASSFEIGVLEISESPQRGARLSDPYGLIERGWSRLAPFLKPVYAISTTRDRDRVVREPHMEGW